MSCCPGSQPEREPRERPVSLAQLLDEDFDCKRRMAQGMCQTLGRPKDREICRSTLDDLAKFNKVDSVEVKQHVHRFLNFYLKVLRWTQQHQPLPLYQQWYGNSRDRTLGSSQLNASASMTPEDGSLGDLRVWLEEGKAYLAMKTYEDGSTIIYAAVAKDPNAGWAEQGFKTLTQRPGACAASED